MQAIEFTTEFTNGNYIEVPADYAKLLKKNQSVRIIMLIAVEEDEDTAWRNSAAQVFFDGYDEADAIYDQL